MDVIDQITLAANHETWQSQFAHERARLLAALGELTAGGPVEGLQHIGATSVHGMLAQPCVDIALAVWPFPLVDQPQAALRALDYEPIAGYEGAPEQRYRHRSGQVQLFVVEAGSDLWTNYALLRDYWRANADATREAVTNKKALAANPIGYQTAKEHWLAAVLDDARRWWISHTGFAPVEQVTHELAELKAQWFIASGWALDLFLGRVTRVHHDVDVVVARSHQLALQQHLTARGWQLVTPFEKQLMPWPMHMTLELPRHQVHAHRNGEFIDILLTDLDQGRWHYRRNPAITRSADRLSLAYNGLPYLAPELILLFKSQNTSDKPRPQDQIDFEAVRALLDAERRAWLRWALIASDPAHPWITQLT